MRNLILTMIIWIICFTAITVGASMSYRWYRHLGKDITIKFKDVSGLVPNQSKIMYLGVDIGTVNDIYFDIESGLPVVEAKVNRHAIELLGSGSKFWIVRPEFGLGEIENLSAISTGDYIEVFPEPGDPADDFIGLEEEPTVHEFSSGLRITLKASTAIGLDVGSGILYNGLQIGEVGEMGLAPDNKTVLITVYIDKKYAPVIRKSSYFGNISGFQAKIQIFGGSKITLDSIRTLVQGGIKVVTPNLKAAPANNDDTFRMLTREQLMELEDPDSC